MDVEDEEDEERADMSQDISCCQDELGDTSNNLEGEVTNEEGTGGAEACEEMVEEAGDTLEHTSQSDL